MNDQFLKDLRAANVQRQAVWDPTNKLNGDFFLTELAGEVGEMFNVIKKLERERLGLPGSRATHASLEEEMGDVVVVSDLMAWRNGVQPLFIEHACDDDVTSLYGTPPSLRVIRWLGRLADKSHQGLAGHVYFLNALDHLASEHQVSLQAAVTKKFNAVSRRMLIPVTL